MGGAGRCAGGGWQSASLRRVLSAQPLVAEGFREAEEVSGKGSLRQDCFGQSRGMPRLQASWSDQGSLRVPAQCLGSGGVFRLRAALLLRPICS